MLAERAMMRVMVRSRIMSRVILVGPQALLAVLLAAPLAAASSAPARDVATVDGKGVSPETLTRAAEGMGPKASMLLSQPATRRQLLDHVIDARLLAKEAEAEGIDKSPEFAAALDDARASILAGLVTKAKLAEATTDAKLKAVFTADPARFSKKQVKASHIILADAAQAQQVLAEALAPGADFEALAKQRSTGPSATRGGDLGWIERGRMVPEFEAAAFATPKGKVYPKLVKTQFGWHVIKVDDVRGDEPVAFDDVKDRIREQVEHDVKETLIQALRAKAKVAVDEEALRRIGS
jgi:peptidyl-prolyl cis-trans isomerase C